MSQENVEVVRQALAANHSDGLENRLDSMLTLWDPSCEYTRVTAAVDPETYRGHDGMRRYISDMVDTWAEWQIEPDEVFEAGPDTVFATFRFRANGKDTGAPVEARLATVFVLADGKILRGHTYPSREDALEAVGLSE